MPTATHPFIAARDFLLAHRADYEAAVRGFRWPSMDIFNWALDYFDTFAAGNTRPALIVAVEDRAPEIRTFQEMADGSARLASFFRALGMRRGDRLLLMLGNETALWETLLACMKLGVVVIPASTLLAPTTSAIALSAAPSRTLWPRQT
jgi:acetyl-CoA synthetase